VDYYGTRSQANKALEPVAGYGYERIVSELEKAGELEGVR
jgi:hypothetical protein